MANHPNDYAGAAIPMPRLSDDAVIQIHDFIGHFLDLFEARYGDQIHRHYELCTAIAARSSQVGQYCAAVMPAALRVVKARQHAADVLVELVVSRPARGSDVKATSGVALRNSCTCSIVRSRVSSISITNFTGASSGSFLVGNKRPVQAHNTLDKTHVGQGRDL